MHAGGFTLIELMFVMVLLVIILGALYSSFSLAEKALNGLDSSLLELQECRNALDRMSREIDSTFYNSSDTNCIFKIEDRDIFGKETSRFRFTALSPIIPGISAISYYVEEKDGKLTLYKKIHSMLNPDNAGNGGDTLGGTNSSPNASGVNGASSGNGLNIMGGADSSSNAAGANSVSFGNGTDIIDKVDSFTVEADNNGAWVKTWDASVTGTIPDKIRITITVLMKGKPVTLYETVTPKIGNTL